MGQRVAHGMLTLSYAVGSCINWDLWNAPVLAFRGLEMKFSLPVVIGDTIHGALDGQREKEMEAFGRWDRQRGNQNPQPRG